MVEPAQTGLERATSTVKSALVDIGLLEKKAEETNGVEGGKENVNGHS